MIKNIVVAIIIFVPVLFILVRFFRKPDKCGCEGCSMKNSCKADFNQSGSHCSEHFKED